MTMPARPEWLESSVATSRPAVDRDAKVLRGYVVAELGEFREPDPRGQFVAESLERIVELGNQPNNGLKSGFRHPGLSSDGLGKHLGRSQNYRLNSDGSKVLADLHFADVAFKSPPDGGGTPLGEYVFDLAEQDSEAIASSLRLKPDEYGRNGDGKLEPFDRRKHDGQVPIWIPTELHASDIVSDGAATDSLLSAEMLDAHLKRPDDHVRAATAIIDHLFGGEPHNVLEARLTAFVDRYLVAKFGTGMTLTPEDDMSDPKKPETPPGDSDLKDLKQQVGTLSSSVQSLAESIAAEREERKEAEDKQKRADEILALCKKAGYPDYNELVAGDDTVEQCRSKVLEFVLEKRQLPPADDGDPDRPGAPARTEAELRAEFRKTPISGMTEDEYVLDCQIEAGNAHETAAVLGADQVIASESIIKELASQAS